MPRATNLKAAERHAKTLGNELYVYALRLAAVAIVAAVTAITAFYAYSVFYDREALLTDAFRCVTDALDASGSQHWLVNGSLLGAVRLQHFVMWDTELDVAVLVDRLKDFVPIVGRVTESCSHLTLNRITSTHDRNVLTAPDPAGREATIPGFWEICNNRVCIVLYEYLKAGEQLLSTHGSQAISTALPTSKCTVSGIEATCPNDGEFFLNGAYGSSWRTERLTTLFK